MADQEKRQAQRFELSAPAMIEWPATSSGEGCLFLVARNLSGGGAYFQAVEPLQEATPIKVHIFLDVGELEGITLDGQVFVQVKGAVLRRDPDGMAVRFSEQCQVTPLGSGEHPAHH